MVGAPTTLYGPRVATGPLDAAAWIRKIREVNDLTQEQFAERVDVHRTTVARWETDVHGLEFQNVRRVLAAFPEAGALFAGDTTAKRPTVPPLKNLETREISALVDRLPIIKRLYIRDMVYRLLGRGRPEES